MTVTADTFQWIGYSGTWNATDADWQIMDGNGKSIGSPRTWVNSARMPCSQAQSSARSRSPVP